MPETEIQANDYRRGHAPLIAGLFVLAIAVRVMALGRESFWLDEAVTAEMTAGSFGEVLVKSARDSTPPLYFAGLWLWRVLVPATDAGIRLYSVAWSIIGLGALSLFARSVAGCRVATVALALAAVHPLDVIFAQEARMYAATAALLLAGWALMWAWLRAPGRHRTWLLVAYAFSALLALLAHYVAIAVLLAQGTFCLACLCRRRRWRDLVAFGLACGTAAVVFAMWYGFVLRMNGGFNRDNFAWMPGPTLKECVVFVVREFVWGHAFWIWPIGAVLMGGGLLALVAWWIARTLRGRTAHGRKELALLGWMIVAPVIFAVVLSYAYQPIYLAKNFSLFLLPAFLVMCAAAICETRTHGRRVTAMLVVLVGFGSGTAVQHATIQKTDWRLFAREVCMRNPRPRIAFFPDCQQIPARRYLESDLVVVDYDTAGTASSRETWICCLEHHSVADVPEEAKAYRALMSLGAPRRLPIATDLVVVSIAPDRK